MNALGIDPAARGTGLAWGDIEGNRFTLQGTKTLKVPTEFKDRDVAAELASRMIDALDSLPAAGYEKVAVIEDPWQSSRGLAGKSSNLAHKYNGITFGVSVAVMLGAGFRIVPVPARAWKSHFGFTGKREKMAGQAQEMAALNFKGIAFGSQNEIDAALILQWFANLSRLRNQDGGKLW